MYSGNETKVGESFQAVLPKCRANAHAQEALQATLVWSPAWQPKGVDSYLSRANQQLVQKGRLVAVWLRKEELYQLDLALILSERHSAEFDCVVVQGRRAGEIVRGLAAEAIVNTCTEADHLLKLKSAQFQQTDAIEAVKCGCTTLAQPFFTDSDRSTFKSHWYSTCDFVCETQL